MKKSFLFGAVMCAIGMFAASASAQDVTKSDIVGKWEFKKAQNVRSCPCFLRSGGHGSAVVDETENSMMRDIEFLSDGTVLVQVAVDRDPDGNYMFSTYEAKWSLGKSTIPGVAEITITTENATIVCQLLRYEDNMTITPPANETFLSFKCPNGISQTSYLYHRK